MFWNEFITYIQIIVVKYKHIHYDDMFTKKIYLMNKKVCHAPKFPPL